jgi:hypothetical protein
LVLTHEPSRPTIEPIDTATHRVVVDGREFVFSGQAILTRCPDCEAPMTLLWWLGTGDCWRCECSVSLDTEIIEQLRQASPSIAVDDAVPSTPIFDLPLPRPKQKSDRNDPRFDFLVQQAMAEPDLRLAELARLTSSTSAAQRLTNFFNSLPAWFVSFLLHLFMILILALFVYQNRTDETMSLVVSTFLDKSRTAGGIISLDSSEKELADDLRPDGAGLEANLSPRELETAQADALELTLDPNPLGTLPALADLRQQLSSGQGSAAIFAARDPRLRQEIVEQAGGTLLTEAAVARGLRWLASVQNADGSWSLAKYDQHTNPKNKGDAAATSLALLPFLGAGQTHEFGIYRSTVTRGLAWLIKNQKPDGDLRINFSGQAGMYAHGQAAIVLCEAYAMTGDERFREPALKAIRFIQAVQHRRGGWRYQPGQEGDTSVLGWQLMALQSARASNLGTEINPDTFRLADYFLDSVSIGGDAPRGALYRYQPGEGDFTHSMTAEGLLCRMYLGWRRDDPRLMHGVKWLLDKHLPSSDSPNLYYWYYGTQVFHHYGGIEWERWNGMVRDLLVEAQEKRGKNAGSWSPKACQWGPQGERIYTTSLAVCTLEVYYRHLPIFKPLDLKAP